jgi:hypothetical protein
MSMAAQLFALISLALLSARVEVHLCDVPQATVYYVPFDAETYVPVTRYDIGAESSSRVCIGDATFASEVEAVLGRGKPGGSFEEQKVRLLFVRGDRSKSFYVDQKGAVALNGSISSLNERDFNELKVLMRRVVPRDRDTSVLTRPGDRRLSRS